MQSFLSSSPLSSNSNGKANGSCYEMVKTTTQKRAALQDLSSQSLNKRASILPTPDASPIPLKKQKTHVLTKVASAGIERTNVNRERRLWGRELLGVKSYNRSK